MDTIRIGSKIATARKKINMSQAQLAQHIFVSPQAVGKWERGESMPDIVTFNRLAQLLSVDLNYFSDSFPSTGTDEGTVQFSEKQPLESTEKKLNWDMSGGNWVDADFSGLKNLHEKFSSSNMQRCRFIGSDLSGLLLKRNHVERCDFSDSEINNSFFQYSHLTKNFFDGCSMKKTEFVDCHITDCDFSEADFTEAKFKSGAFDKSETSGAVWKRTSFIAAQIADVIFEGSIENCYFENCDFKRVLFQDAVLTDTFFKCKSLKRIKFINCRADRMTYEFLKNGNADLTEVTPI